MTTTTSKPDPVFAPVVIESSYGHTLMGTDYNEAHEAHEACLTCGGMWALRDRDGDGKTGVLQAANGDPALPCTRDTEQVHGYERVCEAENGRPCDNNLGTGVCVHVAAVCNCLFCA